MEVPLTLCENSGIDICPDRNPSGLEYADETVLLSQKQKAVSLPQLDDSARMIGMLFDSSKLRMLLQSSIGSQPNFVYVWE